MREISFGTFVSLLVGVLVLTIILSRAIDAQTSPPEIKCITARVFIHGGVRLDSATVTNMYIIIEQPDQAAGPFPRYPLVQMCAEVAP